MGGAGAKLWLVVGIGAFLALVLGGLGVAALGFIFVAGAPHAIPRSPALAAISFGVAFLLVASGILLLRRSVRVMTAAPEGGEQKSLGTVLYTSAGIVLLTVIGVIAFPYVYEPLKPARGSVEYGDYLVEPTLSSACGPGAHRIFYKRRLVTKVAGVTAFSPRNPARLLYNAACAKNGSESGAFYFSGALAAPVQVNPLGMDEPGDWFNLYWSPDDKFVIVPAYGHATLVNLKTGQSLGFLSELLGSKEVFSSNSQFREWSPDGKKMAAVVLSTYARNDRSLYSESELMEIDPATLTKRYVATISKPDGWGVGEYGWVGKDGSYDLVVDSSVENDSRVYRKR